MLEVKTLLSIKAVIFLQVTALVSLCCHFCDVITFKYPMHYFGGEPQFAINANASATDVILSTSCLENGNHPILKIQEKELIQRFFIKIPHRVRNFVGDVIGNFYEYILFKNLK